MRASAVREVKDGQAVSAEACGFRGECHLPLVGVGGGGGVHWHGVGVVVKDVVVGVVVDEVVVGDVVVGIRGPLGESGVPCGPCECT